MGGSRVDLPPVSPAGSRSADHPHGPGLRPHCPLLLPAPSSALQPPSLLGGSPARGWSALSLPPPNSCARGGGSAAPSSPVAGCPSPPRGWGPPSGSPPTPGSSSPWAAADGTLGAAARVSDTSPALLLVSGLPRSASPGCSSAPSQSEVASVPLLLLASAPVPLESPYLRPYGWLVLQA